VFEYSIAFAQPQYKGVKSLKTQPPFLIVLIFTACIGAAIFLIRYNTTIPQSVAAMSTATASESPASAEPGQPTENLPTATPTASPTPRPAVVVLDPGHGGDDDGAGVPGIDEKDITLKVCKRVYSLMSGDRGAVDLRLTRYGDDTTTLAERTEQANAADFFISVHCNTLEESSAIHGVITFFYNHPEDKPFTSEQLADTLQTDVLSWTGANDRGVISDGDLYLMHHTTVPAVLIEIGFITNPAELKNLTDDSYLDCVAQGIRQAVMSFAGRVRGKG
jgi:N-acetylmuramoyl-L-alanine amidase